MQISINEAKYLALQSQRLFDVSNGTTKKDLLKIIGAIGYIQIDTISIVERAHHHVLWTRMPAYQRDMLDELLEKDKKIFEYWSHAAAFLPMRDFRYTFYRRDKYRVHYKTWSEQNKKIVKHVLDRIKAEGPLQSRDFEDEGKHKTGWWDWKPAKYALQHLFHEGTLMIASRKGFQKVYDLTENILPKNVDTSIPTEEEYTGHLILNAINANGLAGEKEMIYQRYHSPLILKSTINKLAEEKKILELKIKGIEKEIYYTTKQNLKHLKEDKNPSQIHILSPFDNLIIQRKRLKNIFRFDYVIECYVPAVKRKFGYFCMPVLAGSEFIGKVDAKADRAKKVFEVINYFPEKGKKLNTVLKNALKIKVKELAIFTGCEEVNWNNKI
jgi:uncharacterized protein YcaQ